MRPCELHDLGLLPFPEAWDRQRALAERRKLGEIPDQLLFVEHPPVVTMGRNGQEKHLLASPEQLAELGIAYVPVDRGGDVTFHGPGQIVCYPILDLREWKRDVGAYLRALEQLLIDAIADCGLTATRWPGKTGVWIGGRKVAAMGVHLSRWVTTHGFALNYDTDLRYFRHIVPCGLTEPVTSLWAEGCRATKAEVVTALTHHFAQQFHLEILVPQESFS
ncbi:MAG: lipoyl(octanoyl) transferase LipB [Bryobacteraceae bacterium]|nr:lipoyl(octanoyl) transferase LipB [Bryobacteraceae bacterium]